ncbi:hypothetical protein FRC03_006498 [Tulasnella sp. 419]|nr:hypothetical protein FRC03_006498 [Tulasnella sp. 419]
MRLTISYMLVLLLGTIVSVMANNDVEGLYERWRLGLRLTEQARVDNPNCNFESTINSLKASFVILHASTSKWVHWDPEMMRRIQDLPNDQLLTDRTTAEFVSRAIRASESPKLLKLGQQLFEQVQDVYLDNLRGCGIQVFKCPEQHQGASRWGFASDEWLEGSPDSLKSSGSLKKSCNIQ